VTVAGIGLIFVMASLLSLSRPGQLRMGIVRDAVFLLGLFAVFVIQLIAGAEVAVHPGDSGGVNTIAILVVICFTIGVARAWELIGGPSIRLTHEVRALVRNRERDVGSPEG